MDSPDKKSLSERDISTTLITPAVKQGEERGLILHRKTVGILYRTR
jgi:hypothetical protein